MSEVVVKPKSEHKGSVIFFHGLGDQGHGWAQGFEEIAHPNVKYIFPNAPDQPVTLNGGMRMPSWFDIKGLSVNDSEDIDGIKAAAKRMLDYAKKEVEAGICPSNIILGGFSQGGAVALHAGLTSTTEFGGILALSCWLPMAKEFPSTKKQSTSIKIWGGHGSMDPLVPLQWAQLSHQVLQACGYQPSLKTYDMMHSSCDKEMKDVKVAIGDIIKV